MTVRLREIVLGAWWHESSVNIIFIEDTRRRTADNTMLDWSRSAVTV